jgi:hypothetical protein
MARDKEYNVFVPDRSRSGGVYAYRTVAKTTREAKQEAAEAAGFSRVPRGTKVRVLQVYQNRGSVRRTAKAYKRAGFSRSDIAEMRRSYKKKKNPARKGKQGTWYKGRAARLVRRGGKLVLEVKR